MVNEHDEKAILPEPRSVQNFLSVSINLYAINSSVKATHFPISEFGLNKVEGNIILIYSPAFSKMS